MARKFGSPTLYFLLSEAAPSCALYSQRQVVLFSLQRTPSCVSSSQRQPPPPHLRSNSIQNSKSGQGMGVGEKKAWMGWLWPVGHRFDTSELE